VSVRREERPDILSGTQISVNFRGLKALQGVDIHVPEGAVVGLVGPNGAGKSTLLGVLSGDLTAQQGVVRLGGKDVSGLAPEVRVRRGLARTFQLPQLFDELTVREHLTLPRRLAQAPSREWNDPLTGRFLHRDIPEEQEVDALLASLGLEPVADTPAGALPLGLTRLVEIARAAATHPTVILLDEPFSGLNPAESRRLSRTLASLNQAEGIAMVLVEHDVEVVFDLSERVFVLDFGELIAAGTPAEIRRHPAVRAAYLGASNKLRITSTNLTTYHDKIRISNSSNTVKTLSNTLRNNNEQIRTSCPGNYFKTANSHTPGKTSERVFSFKTPPISIYKSRNLRKYTANPDRISRKIGTTSITTSCVTKYGKPTNT
jgi:branched-chain amino acid transport system ATP-binding protein